MNDRLYLTEISHDFLTLFVVFFAQYGSFFLRLGLNGLHGRHVRVPNMTRNKLEWGYIDRREEIAEKMIVDHVLRVLHNEEITGRR